MSPSALSYYAVQGIIVIISLFAAWISYSSYKQTSGSKRSAFLFLALFFVINSFFRIIDNTEIFPEDTLPHDIFHWIEIIPYILLLIAVKTLKKGK